MGEITECLCVYCSDLIEGQSAHVGKSEERRAGSVFLSRCGGMGSTAQMEGRS